MLTREQLITKARCLYLNAGIVNINTYAIEKLDIKAGQASLVTPRFPFTSNNWLTLRSEEVVYCTMYLLAQISLQYRFWWLNEEVDDFDNRFKRYEYGSKVGSTAMIAAFDNAWGDACYPGKEILAASQSDQAMSSIFGADFPDISSRIKILASVLSPKGLATARAVIDYIGWTRKVDVGLAQFIAAELPEAYGDPFLKKAQLLLGLIAGWLRSEKIDIQEQLTAYADYQVPSVLRHFGVLEYNCGLAKRVDSRITIEPDSAEEISIRAATIEACDQIANYFGVTSAEVDWWCFQQRKLPTKPFHLTITTNY